jgi:SAM-dependent methyltransferase
MEFTGERVIPGQVDTDLWQEHLSRYALARQWSRRLRLLDAGCGSGYGTALLAETAGEAVGLDLSAEALSYAREHYRRPNLRFVEGDCAALPFPDKDFDLVVAFEVIEHLPDPEAFLRETRRVLRRRGRLLVSTPNRRFYTEERGYKNPFHVREFDAAEFDALLGKHFAHRRVLQQNHVPAICFQGTGGTASAELDAGFPEPKSDEPHFFLAICSPAPLPEDRGFVFLPQGGNVLRERERHIHKLEAIKQRVDQEMAERRAWAEKLQAEIQEKDVFIRRMQQEFAEKEAELKERTEWARRLEAEVSERNASILERQQAVDNLEAELKERTEWARGLEAEAAERDARILERQQAVEKLEAELKERTEWARSLAAEVAERDTRILERQQTVDNLESELKKRTEWALGLDKQLLQLNAQLMQLMQLNAEAEALRADMRLLLGSLWYRLGKRLHFSPVPEVDKGRKK